MDSEEHGGVMRRSPITTLEEDVELLI